ncbi:solute carrier family 2, facilitated glucose transporter member 9-like [Alosa pseudoharengus]|uniref:solute carrier family 2, facilitated glucose transporter member 9-like n=1 Tax=Alosa pseudoharengus TaxID=34774 RepID=UPI003F8C58F9
MACWVLQILAQNPKLIAAILISGIGGAFQYGIQISILNAPSVFIKEMVNHTCAERYGLVLEHSQLSLIWSFIVSIYCIGGLVGSLFAGRLANKYGRKRSLQLNNLLAISGAVLMGLSKTAQSFELIMAGRFIYGINAGMGLLIHSMYLVECSPKRVRTMIGVTISLYISIGKFTGQLLGLRELLGTKNGWPWLLGFGGVTGLLQLLTLPLLPESPRYLLLMREDRQACEKAMERLWGRGQDHSSEMEDMLAEGAAQKGVRVRGVKELLTEPSVHWQLLTVLVTAATIQLCGINAVFFYGRDLFKHAGINDSQQPYIALGTGLCELLAGTISSLVIENVGKKILLSFGYLIMAGVLVLLTITLYLQSQVPWMSYCSIILIFIFIILFCSGPSATTASLPGDIFNQSFKAAAYTVNGTMMWTCLFLVGMLFPFMVDNMGYLCFLIFLAFCFGTGLFIWFSVPETRNRTVLEIDAEYRKIHSRTSFQTAPAVDTTPTAETAFLETPTGAN